MRQGQNRHADEPFPAAFILCSVGLPAAFAETTAVRREMLLFDSWKFAAETGE